MSVGVIVYFTVMFDHPSCFLTFCRSGIPTSCYIFKCFFITCIRGATALLVAALQPVATRWTRSFQLTHMSREDHAQSLIAMSSQQWRPTVRQELIIYSANNFASTVSFGM